MSPQDLLERLSASWNSLKKRWSAPFRTIALTCFWGALFAWASVSLYRAIAPRLEYPDLEDDTLIFTPIAIQESHGKSFGEVFRFVFHLAHEYGIPSLNIYWHLMQRFLGLEVKYYSLSLFALHHLNALLFWVLLARGFRMGIAASAFSAIFFLVYSPQFHAYLWPISFQHLSVLSGVFLTLILYRETENRIAQGAPRALWWKKATVAAAVLSSLLRVTIFLAPFHIALDIFCTSGSEQEIRRRLRWWTPLFLVYLPFRILSFFRGAEGQAISVRLLFLDLGVPYWVIGALLLAASVSILLFLHRLWKLVNDPLSTVRRRMFAQYSPMTTFIAGCVFALLSLGHIAPWILAFKLSWIPEASLYKTLLYDRWHVVTLPAVLKGGPTLTEALSFFVLLLFAYVCFRSLRERLPFLGWYLVACAGVAQFDTRIPSRYYIYLSPLVAVCVATLISEGGGFVLRKMKLSAKLFLGTAMAGIAAFLILAHTTTLQTRLSLSRLPGLITHYDYVLAAETIRQDLASHPEKAEHLRQPQGGLHVCGIQPAWFFMQNHAMIAPDWDAETFHPFKYVLGATLHWPIERATEVRVNGPCRPGEICYAVARDGVYDAEGNNLDPFYRNFKEGMRRFYAGENREALAMLTEAVQARPFFFRYLAPGIPPEEFSHPSGRTLLELINQLTWWIIPTQEFRFEWVKKEHLNHLHALAVMAYLEDLEGIRSRSSQTLETLKKIAIRKGEQGQHPLQWGDIQRITDGLSNPKSRVKIRDFLIEKEKIRSVPLWVKPGEPEEPMEISGT